VHRPDVPPGVAVNPARQAADASSVTERYRVPKLRVPAEIRTSAVAARPVFLFLNPSAEGHAGRERPSDLLNFGGHFLVVEDESGEIEFLNRDGTLTVTVAAELEGAIPTGAPASACRVAVVLHDGSTLEGEVRYQLPEAQRRLQDYLNADELFLPVRCDDGRVCLVNKRGVVRVVARSGEE